MANGKEKVEVICTGDLSGFNPEPGLFDVDESNGNYDVPTLADFARWDNEKRLAADRKRRANATHEELADPSFDVPY